MNEHKITFEEMLKQDPFLKELQDEEQRERYIEFKYKELEFGKSISEKFQKIVNEGLNAWEDVFNQSARKHLFGFSKGAIQRVKEIWKPFIKSRLNYKADALLIEDHLTRRDEIKHEYGDMVRMATPPFAWVDVAAPLYCALRKTHRSPNNVAGKVILAYYGIKPQENEWREFNVISNALSINMQLPTIQPDDYLFAVYRRWLKKNFRLACMLLGLRTQPQLWKETETRINRISLNKNDRHPLKLLLGSTVVALLRSRNRSKTIEQYRSDAWTFFLNIHQDIPIDLFIENKDSEYDDKESSIAPDGLKQLCQRHKADIHAFLDNPDPKALNLSLFHHYFKPQPK